jgi:membrane associated rhomboid family serine protease
VLDDGEAWRLATSLLLHGGLTHLAVDTFFLGVMGPGEAAACLVEVHHAHAHQVA